MYVRFVTPLIDAETRVEAGIFQSRQQLLTDQWLEWLEDAFQEEIDWFNDHLAVPTRFGIHFRRSASIWGVCWFARMRRKPFAMLKTTPASLRRPESRCGG